MLKLARTLAICDEKFFTGWVLARIEVNINGKAEAFNNKLVLHKERKAIFEVSGFDEQGILQQKLKTLLMLPKNSLEANVKHTSDVKNPVGEFVTEHIFSMKEINTYVKYTGDKNIIHKQDSLLQQAVIVPGLCMLNWLKEYLNFEVLNWKISFLSPVYVDKKVCFYRKDEKIYAYVDGTLAFEIKLL